MVVSPVQFLTSLFLTAKGFLTCGFGFGFGKVITTSTLLFLLSLSSSTFSTLGFNSPWKFALILILGTPLAIKNWYTALVLFSESFVLYSKEPSLSVCPISSILKGLR